MCHSIPAVRALQQTIPNNSAAKSLGPGERLTLGVQALAGHQTITGLADDAGVSRKFVYQPISLADDVAVWARWLRGEVFAVSALPYADCCALFDFVVGELQARVSHCPHRLGPVCTLLKNHRDQLLAFALQLDEDLGKLAAAFEVPVGIVRDMFDLQTLDKRQPLRWQKAAALRERLRGRFPLLEQAVREQVVRASSIIENINSRLRSYFFLRREIGGGYLNLLQFFLNHRRFLRSEHPERVDKSPAELRTGQPHLHWLEMLGYRRFCRN